MRAYYLQVLDLGPDATEEEIKKAYRQQSKRFHPDVNSSKNATELFQKINEAYDYLTKPQEPSEEPYEEVLSEEEIWRINAWKRAKEKALERERYKRQLIEKIVRYYRPVALSILVFNLVLALDFFLPLRTHHQKILGMSKGFESTGVHSGGSVYRYDIMYFEDFTMRFDRGEVISLDHYEGALVLATPIFSTPMRAQITVDGRIEEHQQIYNIYYVFGYVIPALLLTLALFFYLKKPMHQLNAAIISAFFGMFQTVVFFLT